jgi:hypothetical protein
MSSDEKAKTREKETITRIKFRDDISPDKKVKMRTPEKLIKSNKSAKLQKMTSRLGISPDEMAKMKRKQRTR